MPHIYLSYSRQDADFVDLIETDLNERGHPVWRDTSKIQGDQDWSTAISQALQSGYALVVAYSDRAAESDWVKQEVETARQAGIPIVLLLLEDCDLPAFLREATLVNFAAVREASGLDQLRHYRRSIQHLIEALDTIYPVRVFIKDLSDADDKVREQAAQKLGDLGDLSASEALILALTDPDVDVRFYASEALGKLSSAPAVKPLIRTMENDVDPDVCAVAARALGQIGLPEAITALLRQLKESDRFVRASAVLALGDLKAAAAVPELIRLERNDPISDVRAAARRALCMIGGPEAERTLRRAKVDCQELLA